VTKIETLADQALLKGADPKRTFAVYEIAEAGKPISRALVFFEPAKTMALPDPALSVDLAPGEGGYVLTLKAAKLARAVWVSFGDADAEVSDNALDLLPGETRTLTVTSASDLATLKQGLTVRSLHGATTASVP
jgi:beta-mannosidase